MSNTLGNMPPAFGSGTRGVVPAPTAADVAAQNILRADGTWGAGPSGTLPSQTSNAGKLLTTDGTNASWSGAITVSGGNATVGGTLTVSGTGLSSVAGSLAVAGQVSSPTNSTLVMDFAAGADQGRLLAKNSAGTYTNPILVVNPLTTSGNLTVSGTGTSSVAGKLAVGRASMVGGVAMTVVGASNANLQVDAAGGGLSGISLYAATDADAYSALQLDGNKVYINTRSGGNLLLGTTTDSANGKLQLATHTTSAGGIGFGTDTSFNRIAAGKLAVTDSGSTPTFSLYASSTERVRLEASGADVYLSSVNASASLYLRSGNLTTALTLDSSQRCILAGALRLNNAYTAGAPTATGYVTLQDSAGNTYKVLVGT